MEEWYICSGCSNLKEKGVHFMCDYWMREVFPIEITHCSAKGKKRKISQRPLRIIIDGGKHDER